jgi:hypothetical protein
MIVDRKNILNQVLFAWTVFEVKVIYEISKQLAPIALRYADKANFPKTSICV